MPFVKLAYQERGSTKIKPETIGHADYGIDAPAVVRNLYIVGLVGALIWLTVAIGFWPGRISIPVAGVVITIELSGVGLGCAIGFLLTGSWMVWSSKVGKVKSRERLLDLISWKGNEQVLDLGCGRGLMLIGAAKRLTTGKAVGIDIWRAEDLSGNNSKAILENARRENVESRVEIATADMRKMPFANGTFNVVVSRFAIHNIYSAAERAKAIREVARVLKPGGHAIIEDIRYLNDYTATFAEDGCPDIRPVGSHASPLLASIITLGQFGRGH